MKRNTIVLTRNIGIASMIVTLATAGFASYLYELAPNSAIVSATVGIAVVSFSVWAVCGLFLWFKLWVWLFSSWPTRGNAKNLAWSLLVMAGSIILPLFVPRLLAHPEAPETQGGVA